MNFQVSDVVGLLVEAFPAPQTVEAEIARVQLHVTF